MKLVLSSLLISVLLLLSCGPKATPTPTPTPTAQRTTYQYAMMSSNVKAISGRVFLDGAPLPDWPPTGLWRADWPKLPSGFILVVVNMQTGSIGRKPWQESAVYIRPGEAWTIENPDMFGGGGTDVYYFAKGYVSVMFENVPTQEKRVTMLPDITLVPLRDEWVLRPES